MDAEEYLQPRSSANTTTSSGSVNGTLKGNNHLQDNSWPESPQNFHNRHRERARYRGYPTGSESRYCSDPLKVLGGRETSDGYSSDSTKTREATVGNLKLDLPVDDDDYLMPSPQNNQNASTYLDLIGGDSKPQGQYIAAVSYGPFMSLCAKYTNVFISCQIYRDRPD